MNKKIKVIELINRIYENKNVPNRIIFTKMEFSFDIKSRDYRRENDGFMFFPFLTKLMDWVHMEVEILEDEEKINIQEIELAGLKSFVDVDEEIDNVNLAYKYNELLLAVKQLDKKINKEE